MNYTFETKNAVIGRYINDGITISQIAQDTGIPRSTLYSWIKRYQKEGHQINSALIFTKRDFQRLENRIKHLEGILSILKTVPCSVHASLKERLNAIEALQGQYSIHMLCEAMNIARGTFYNHILRNKRDNAWYVKRREELRMKIQEIYDGSNQIFGSKKIAAILKKEGVRVSDKMVANLMQDMGLISIRQDSKKIYAKEVMENKDYVRRQFDVQYPNQVWCSDVTLFNHKQKHYYICVVMDLFARKIVGYMVSHRNSTHLVRIAVQKAYKVRRPDAGLIFHSDRGGNYCSKALREYLVKLGIVQSFSRPHMPYDNSVMESFFSTMKREELYRTKYRSERELMEAISAYMAFYNEKRPHTKLKYKTPSEVEAEYANSGPQSSN